MTRSIQNALLACGLCMVAGAAAAQAPITARKAYDNCVYQSVLAQLELLPAPDRRRADISMVTEAAFQACTTEEQVLGLVLASIDRNQAPVLLTAVKIRIKREMQAIAANPEAYKTAR
jgi:hypothetical protein